MFATPAMAQTLGAAGGGGPQDLLISLAPFLAIGVFFYLLILRPQQTRMKQHREAISAIKRGDTVVLSSGMIGKVVRVEEAEVGLEIAQGVTVKVVKTMVSEVRTRGAPAPANDAKS
ncbi:MAG TPA: preprotein translocase subunit YajC [Caulobacteraceae bacterium]|jgi:preprotein translocase subunit YajC|nr:preprotein translocase subunit YajC [Caulobacteraceae bacterium]